MNLKGRVVFITGSSDNIGAATAKLFASSGATVVVNGMKNIEGAEKVVKEIEENGGKATIVMGDLSDESVVKEIFEKIMNQYGTIDILINNAGHGHDKDIFDSTKEDWYKALDDCLITAVLCTKYAGKIMMEKKSGVILNTTSIRGISYAGREGLVAYSAAKAALASFTQTMAKRMAPFVNVNAVAHGFVYKTAYESFPKDLKDRLINSTLLKRFISVDDIAEAFLYLANAKSVTGEILVVDGGFQLKQD